MGIVDPAVMLSPLTNQEAALSSRIEGTQATVEEVLEHEAGQEYSEEKSQDIQEVLNYRKALMLAKDNVQQRPIRLGLIRELHRILMDSVRGKNKEPGQFRKEQNWIGAPGCTIEQATYVPPNPLQLMDHLQALENYLGSDDIDPIVQRLWFMRNLSYYTHLRTAMVELVDAMGRINFSSAHSVETGTHHFQVVLDQQSPANRLGKGPSRTT